jgi:hypothetical protein
MTAATSLLDFILRLLKDPQAQAEFGARPEQVLAANGLTDVSAADIRDTLPLVTDNRFVDLNSSHAVSPLAVSAAGGSRIHAAIQYLHHITCTYRYDDHGAHAQHPGHVNIWATAFRHPGHDRDGGLHSFGSGDATTLPGGPGSPAAYSGDTVGSHDSTGFGLPDSGGTASPAVQDDYQTYDAHGGFGDSCYGQDTYYGQDTEHAINDVREPHKSQELHIYLDLH